VLLIERAGVVGLADDGHTGFCELILQRPTVVAWRGPCNAPENAGHVVLIGETARPGNLSQRSARIAHQRLRSLHSPVKQELIGCLPSALAETPNEV